VDAKRLLTMGRTRAMKSDFAWLDKWSDYLDSKNVLELGCGQGIDTRRIVALANSVVACDLSPPPIIKGASEVLVLDHSKNFPFETGTFDVVVASLCLHYFCWQTTQDIVSEISRVLAPDGFILVRVNSENDNHFGATGHAEIQPNFYMVKGQQKRFFNIADVESLFESNWKLTAIEEKSIDRYGPAKKILEFGGQKVAR
jgi:SAM-dependent methyltransferase